MNWVLLLALLGAAAAPAESPPDRPLALQVARAIPIVGDEIEDATIVVDGGRIVALGPRSEVEIPREARVIRMPRGVAMPGLIACHTTAGLRVTNERLADVPYLSVLDGIDPSSIALESLVRDGVTAVHVLAGDATRFGGQGAVIRPVGRMVEDMVVRTPSAMKVSLRPPSGETRMGNMAALRRRFHDLYRSLLDLDPEAKKPRPLPTRPDSPPGVAELLRPVPRWGEVPWDRIPRDKIPERDRALVDLVRGKLPAFIACPQASDVLRAFELIDANGLRGALVLSSDGWRAAPALATREPRVPVVIGPELEVWETDSRTGEEVRHVTPRELHSRGVRFAVRAQEVSSRQSGPFFSRRGDQHLWYQAARLVRLGIPRAEALRAITLTPAEVIGLGHRLGSLEVGKDGDIAVFSGDPLDARSWVEVVIVEGRVVYEWAEDPDLERVRRPMVRPF